MQTTKVQISLRIHPRSLISPFIVRYLDSVIPILAKAKIRVSVAEQTVFFMS